MTTSITLPESVTLSTYIASLEPQSGDLVLIQHPHRVWPENIVNELLIVDKRWSTSPIDLDLLVIPPESWIALQKAAIREWITPGLTPDPVRLTTHVPLDRIIDTGAVITFRPSSRTIRDSIFNGSCPYERCHHGIVIVSSASTDDLGLMESSQNAHLTLCPFCMGIELLRKHEGLVRAVADATMLEPATEELLRDSAIRAHRQRLNYLRLEMGFAVLPHDSGLYGLGVQPGGDGDQIEVAPLIDYLDNVTHAEMGTSAADAALTPIMDRSAPLTRTKARGDRISRRRGRGRTSMREFRRLDMDPRPGSGYTHEVSLDDETQLAEATLRSHDYHNSLRMGPPPLRTLQVGVGGTEARQLTDGNEDRDGMHDAVMGAFNRTEPTTHFFRPGTPRPPPLPERPRTTYGKTICSEPFEFYKLIQERVMSDVCGICLERYEDNGEALSMAMPCGHFFHEECVRGRAPQPMNIACPFRCEGLVRVQVGPKLWDDVVSLGIEESEEMNGEID